MKLTWRDYDGVQQRREFTHGQWRQLFLVLQVVLVAKKVQRGLKAVGRGAQKVERFLYD